MKNRQRTTESYENRLRKKGAALCCSKTGQINVQFKILSALAMVLVVSGHAGYDAFTLQWLFPYDSFHMPLFIFISGYFSKSEQACMENAGAYLKKKTMRLLVPFLAWNLFYGIFGHLLFLFTKVEWGTRSFVEGFIVRPLAPGNCFFTFNDPSWFLLTLFEVGLLNYFLHILLKRCRVGQTGIFMIYLLLACAAVTLARNGLRTPVEIVITRMLYMLFWYGCGSYYKQKLEYYDTLSNCTYFLTVICLQLILVALFHENGIIAGVWNSEFTNNAFWTILAAANGIAFWLRISKILEPALKESRLIRYLADRTFSIMMHHFLAFFCVLAAAYFIQQITGFPIGADLQAMRTDMWYRYCPFGINGMRVFYVIAGIALPLVACWIYEHISRRMTYRK